MNKPSEREAEVLQTILKVLRERLDPPRIILFGSRAEGRARRESDFDVAVDGVVPEFRTRWQIAEAVGDAIGLYEADVVYLNALTPSFRGLVLKTGKIIYEREEKRSAA